MPIVFTGLLFPTVISRFHLRNKNCWPFQSTWDHPGFHVEVCCLIFFQGTFVLHLFSFDNSFLFFFVLHLFSFGHCFLLFFDLYKWFMNAILLPSPPFFYLSISPILLFIDLERMWELVYDLYNSITVDLLNFVRYQFFVDFVVTYEPRI